MTAINVNVIESQQPFELIKDCLEMEHPNKIKLLPKLIIVDVRKHIIKNTKDYLSNVCSISSCGSTNIDGSNRTVISANIPIVLLCSYVDMELFKAIAPVSSQRVYFGEFGGLLFNSLKPINFADIEKVIESFTNEKDYVVNLNCDDGEIALRIGALARFPIAITESEDDYNTTSRLLKGLTQ